MLCVLKKDLEAQGRIVSWVPGARKAPLWATTGRSPQAPKWPISCFLLCSQQTTTLGTKQTHTSKLRLAYPAHTVAPLPPQRPWLVGSAFWSLVCNSCTPPQSKPSPTAVPLSMTTLAGPAWQSTFQPAPSTCRSDIPCQQLIHNPPATPRCLRVTDPELAGAAKPPWAPEARKLLRAPFPSCPAMPSVYPCCGSEQISLCNYKSFQRKIFSSFLSFNKGVWLLWLEKRVSYPCTIFERDVPLS